MNKEIVYKTLRNTSLAALYILMVSQVMQHGEQLFGKEDGPLLPFFILLLFSFSAAVVGGLIFGETILLFLDNKRNEGILAALYSIGWLGLFTLLGLVILIVLK